MAENYNYKNKRKIIFSNEHKEQQYDVWIKKGIKMHSQPSPIYVIFKHQPWIQDISCSTNERILK